MVVEIVLFALLQGMTVPARASQRDDSTVASAAAERAQRRFESVRRGALPLRDRVYGRACDAQIGTYCYWYDPSDRPPAPREHPRVGQARRGFLATLDSLARRSPRLGMLHLMRVHYRVDAGDTAEAVFVAEHECHAERWWCHAAVGYARHVTGDVVRAERAFDAALASMDPDRRCAWENPSMLLPPGARTRLERVGCASRARAASRIWALADPMLTRPGNDLRTEFLARRVAALLGPRGMAAYDLRWNRDAEEMLLRYGWPVWWTRERASSPPAAAVRAIVGYERVPSFAFVPHERLLLDSLRVPAADDWDLHAPAPHSRHAPAYAGTWTALPAQVARFRLRDSLRVVAAYSAPVESQLAEPVARLALVRSTDSEPIVSAPSAGPSGTLELRASRRTVTSDVDVVGVEIIDSARSAVARHREGLRALEDGDVALSDLLLHAPLTPAGDAGALDLDQVLPYASPSTVISRERFGVYWEAYCRTAVGPLTVTLTLERTTRTWVSRVRSAVGIDAGARAIRIRWEEAPAAGEPCATRSVILDAAALAPGRYTLRVEARAAAGSAAAERDVELRR